MTAVMNPELASVRALADTLGETVRIMPQLHDKVVEAVPSVEADQPTGAPGQ